MRRAFVLFITCIVLLLGVQPSLSAPQGKKDTVAITKKRGGKKESGHTPGQPGLKQGKSFKPKGQASEDTLKGSKNVRHLIRLR